MGKCRGDDATAGPFQFVIAGAMLVALVGTVLIATQDQGRQTSAARDESLRLDAESLVDMLAGRPGQGWEDGADSVVQLGLQNGNRSGLDRMHLAAMEGALYESTANGLLDYDDALALLGLDADGPDRFHLRVTPIGLQSILTEDLSHIRTAYVGDWDRFLDSSVVLGTSESAMAAEARASIDLDMAPLTAEERDILVALGVDFDDEVHIGVDQPSVEVAGLIVPLQSLITDATLLEGDVYPDIKKYLDLVMAGRLPEYDLVVVGSTVDHSSLTADATKGAFRDWVLAGGTLLVLGSASQNFQWLQPLFKVGTTTVNGGAFAPDVDHPILREPHPLDWTAYDNHELGWDLKDQGSDANYDDFQHIIVEGGEDLLAVSNDGAFGEGRIFLSTYRPNEIATQIGIDEALHFVNNIVVYADRDHLYLDYGPSPPHDTSVAAATRLSHIWDPDLGQVPVAVTVLYWKA